jgi:undecaprenyl-diphosphatase
MRESGEGKGPRGHEPRTSADGGDRTVARDRLFWAAFLALVIAATAVTVLATRELTFPGDLPLLLAVQGLRNPVMDQIMLFVTDIGFEIGSFVVVVLAAFALWLARLHLAALFVFFTLLGDLSGTALKLIVARPRPPDQYLYLIGPRPDFGYPSGHALHAALLYGFLAFICWYHIKNETLRIALTTWLVLLALLTGLSRVYLGQHWPSDVIGGYLVGLALLMGTIKLYTLAEARWGRGRQ